MRRAAGSELRIAVVGARGIPDVPGGVERHCDELYPRLAALGARVTFYRRDGYGSTKDEWNGVRIARAASLRGKGLEAYTHTASAILAARGRCDVLHVHSIGPASLIGFARAAGHRAIVATVHAPDYEQAKWGAGARRLLRYGEKLACTKADATICVAEWYAELLSARYGRTPDVIANGPGLSGVMGRPDNGFADSLGLSAGRYVLCVGRLIPDKRFEDVVAALGTLDDAPTLVIAGDSADSDGYAARLADLGDGRALMPGAVVGEDLASLYRNAAAYVLPSQREGLPVSLQEAMAFGLPCIAADIPASAEVLADAGLTYPPGDVRALTAHLHTVLGDEALSAELGRLASARVSDAYDWDAIARATLEVYERVASAV